MRMRFQIWRGSRRRCEAARRPSTPRPRREGHRAEREADRTCRRRKTRAHARPPARTRRLRKARAGGSQRGRDVEAAVAEAGLAERRPPEEWSLRRSRPPLPCRASETVVEKLREVDLCG